MCYASFWSWNDILNFFRDVFNIYAYLITAKDSLYFSYPPFLLGPQQMNQPRESLQPGCSLPQPHLDGSSLLLAEVQRWKKVNLCEMCEIHTYTHTHICREGREGHICPVLHSLYPVFKQSYFWTHSPGLKKGVSHAAMKSFFLECQNPRLTSNLVVLQSFWSPFMICTFSSLFNPKLRHLPGVPLLLPTVLLLQSLFLEIWGAFPIAGLKPTKADGKLQAFWGEHMKWKPLLVYWWHK